MTGRQGTLAEVSGAPRDTEKDPRVDSASDPARFDDSPSRVISTRSKVSGPLAPGDFAARYRIIESLGSGGMGYIYRALDVRLEREIALKVALEPVPEAPEALLREARLLAALNHPNVVTVHEVGVFAGRAYLVMELLRGETLRARIDRAPPTLGEALGWARELLRGLSATHQARLVHLDVKPENVFLTDDGLLKLLDFGVARQKVSAVTPQDEVAGTIAYMAPEHLLGEPTDARADLFSFGVILHQLVTGNHPYLQPDLRGTMVALVRGDYFGDGLIVDSAIDAVIRSCMARHPNDRPASAARVLEDIERILDERAKGFYRSVVSHVVTDHGNVAFQCVGDRKPVDILVVPGLLSRFDAWWQEPEGAAFIRTLADSGRIILYDRAGLGASERLDPGSLPFPEDEVPHIDAIIEAIGAKNVVVFALGTGTPLAVLYAALRPERVAGLVIYGGAARYSENETTDHMTARADAWGTERNALLCAPSFAGDQRKTKWYASWERGAASPKMARAWMAMLARTDVTSVLPHIEAPTIVLHRQDDCCGMASQNEPLATAIVGAKGILVPGTDHLPFAGSGDIAAHVAHFAAMTLELAVLPTTSRAIRTWLYTDAPLDAQLAASCVGTPIVRGNRQLVQVDRPGLAFRKMRATLARSSNAKGVVLCGTKAMKIDEIIAESENLFAKTPLGTIALNPLASALIEGTAGHGFGVPRSSTLPPEKAPQRLDDVVPFEHKSFSVKFEPGPTIRLDGSIMLRDPEKQLIPHFQRIHECCAGLEKVIIDVRRLTQINSSGLGIFIRWLGWIQAEPEVARYRLEIRIDPKILWQRANLTPLSMIAPDIIKIVST